jgi:hypothetical protein
MHFQAGSLAARNRLVRLCTIIDIRERQTSVRSRIREGEYIRPTSDFGFPIG